MPDVIVQTYSDIIAQEVERVDVISESVQGLPGVPGPRGLPGPPGGATLEFIAGTAVGGHRAVVLDANGELAYASAANLAHMGRLVGITLGAADAGANCAVQNFDQIEEPSWAWDITKPVYLADNGMLTQQLPTAPALKFSMVVGFPISSTSLFVNLREPIILS